MTIHYMTKDGLEKLKTELDYLKTQKMPEIIERIARAKELGDLSENAEYQDAKDEQGFTAGRMAEIESTLKQAEIISESNNPDIIEIGNTIIVESDGQKSTYTITGSNEADPTNGSISNESPLGRAFLGHKIGDKIKIVIPKGEMDCEILEIK